MGHVSRLSAAIMASTVLAMPVGARAGDDYADELRGVAFGSAVNAKTMKLVGQAQVGFQFLRRDGDKKVYRGIPISEVLYGYRDGRLVLVEVWGKEVGPAYDAGCNDLKAGASHEMSKALKKRFGAPVANASTLLDMNKSSFRPFEAVMDLCQANQECDFTRFEVKPPAKPPEARTFVATQVSLEAVRERKLTELTKTEIEDAKKHPLRAKLHEYRCQQVVRFYQGRSRADLDREEESREALLGPVRPAPGATKSGTAASGAAPKGYVLIQPGTFTMGSPSSEAGREDEEVPHTVRITRPFYLKATEVTQGEWKALMGSNPSHFTSCGAGCPVEKVSWDDAVAWCNALSRKEGLPECYSGSTFRGLSCLGYRLPTEAEWEYAARAGTTGATYADRDAAAWYDAIDRGGYTTHAVGLKQANAWGLYDMLGNVREWCTDGYDAYPSSNVSDPVGLAHSHARVVRGGSWFDPPSLVRLAYRNRAPHGIRFDLLGFRPARSGP